MKNYLGKFWDFAPSAEKIALILLERLTCAEAALTQTNQMHFDTRGIKRFCRGVCCKIIISECLISDLDNVQLGNQWK
jgi:hypothetical protein